MPCLFFTNVPTDAVFVSYSVIRLHNEAKRIMGSEIEVHISNERYDLLLATGQKTAAKNVHVFVEAHGRTDAQKKALAHAIYTFLSANRLSYDLDITFRDSPRGTFYFNDQLVEGGYPGFLEIANRFTKQIGALGVIFYFTAMALGIGLALAFQVAPPTAIAGTVLLVLATTILILVTAAVDKARKERKGKK